MESAKERLACCLAASYVTDTHCLFSPNVKVYGICWETKATSTLILCPLWQVRRLQRRGELPPSLIRGKADLLLATLRQLCGLWIMCLYALPLLSLAAHSHSAIHSTTQPAVHLVRRPPTCTACVRPQKAQATCFLALHNDSLHWVHSRSSRVGPFEEVAGAHRGTWAFSSTAAFSLKLQLFMCILYERNC